MKRILYLLTFAISLQSCSLLGFHFKLHNPSKKPSYPSFSKETILLGEPNHLRTNYDVKKYELNINFEPNNKSLNGFVDIAATALQDIDTVQIDLASNLIIEKISLKAPQQSNDLKYSRNCRAVIITLPNRIKMNTRFTLEIAYHGIPKIAVKPPWKGGCVWKKDENKNSWFGVACETEGASIWFPCKDLTNDEADSVIMKYSIADAQTVIVGNGKLIQKEITNSKSSYTWMVTNPINTYDITFYGGRFKSIEDTLQSVTGQLIPLQYWVLNKNVDIAKSHFKQVKKHIQFYEKTYGAYCFNNDSYKLVEAPYAGMEHQSGIAFGSKFKNDINGTDDYIILHETGHEWFGNAITAADLADVWLQEGITTYGEALYLENQYGAEIANRHLLIYRFTIKNNRPIVGPRNKRYFNYRDGDVYVKAAWMLKTLRTQINNDAQFFEILKTFYNTYKLKTTNTTDFINLVNKISNKNYNWFFAQYLYLNTSPILEYNLIGNTFYYKWTATNIDFNQLNIAVYVNGIKYVITPSSQIQAIECSEIVDKEVSFKFNIDQALYGVSMNKKLGKL